VIRVVAPMDKEYGWTRHASSFAAGLSRLEQTELIDWNAPRRRGLRARVRNWRVRLGDSVGISLGIFGRAGMLGTLSNCLQYLGDDRHSRPSPLYVPTG
jgi:hypothetical protein